MQKGDTPLHIAIRGRSRKLAELLLRNPKDGRLLYRPNKTGETPYNIDCSHQKSILTQIFGASKYKYLFFLITHILTIQFIQLCIEKWLQIFDVLMLHLMGRLKNHLAKTPSL